MRKQAFSAAGLWPVPFWAAVLLAICATTGRAEDEFQLTIAPFLKTHCYSCHGEQKQEARIRYDQTTGFQVEDRHLWTMVHEKLSAREMPPEEEPQPAAAEVEKVLAWIEQEQRTLGTGSTRRLNRRELSAALQDLTGLAVDYAASLPGDGKISGFDTGAEGLQDAASSISQIMLVSRRAVDGIRFLEEPAGEPFSLNLREAKQPRKEMEAWKERGAQVKIRDAEKPGLGLLLTPRWLGERDGLDIHVPVPESRRGVVRLKLAVSLQKYFAEVPNPHLSVQVGGNSVDIREVAAPAEKPLELLYEVQLEDAAIEKKGLKISLQSLIEMPYAVKGFENEDKTKPEDKIPGGPGLYRPLFDRKKPPEEQPAPFVVLQEIEIDADFVAQWPPENWQSSAGELKDDSESAKRLLRIWMQRAWRRPVSESEQAPFFDLYEELRAQELSFDDALRAAFQSVLMSGPFRYLSSPADPDSEVALHAIAARLSFMLVGGPPDEELRKLAAEGKLRDPKILDAQVDRLLADERSDAFIRPFVTQWLEMEQPITVVMDYFQKQDFRFGRYLKESMREETIAYISQLFAENRPAGELLDSDWTMLNDSLAWHYGYEGAEGGHFRKFKLPSSAARGGGILSHAGIQSMLCWMGDNWVIYRGAWALRHILDAPPPPPPLEVPELDPSAGDNRGKTFRELLAQHQENEKCSVCHKKMDPLGFAFQNFDISGRWREVEHEKYAREELDGKIAWRGVGKTRPVDAAGQLPRGEEFTSYAECKELLAQNYSDDMVRGLMKNLMLYATGRKPDIDDMAEIRAIMQDYEEDGYPLRDMLKAVFRSRAFLDH